MKRTVWNAIAVLGVQRIHRPFIAYQTGFSAVFTGARKSHLTPPCKMPLML